MSGYQSGLKIKSRFLGHGAQGLITILLDLPRSIVREEFMYTAQNTNSFWRHSHKFDQAIAVVWAWPRTVDCSSLKLLLIFLFKNQQEVAHIMRRYCDVGWRTLQSAQHSTGSWRAGSSARSLFLSSTSRLVYSEVFCIVTPSNLNWGHVKESHGLWRWKLSRIPTFVRCFPL